MRRFLGLRQADPIQTGQKRSEWSDGTRAANETNGVSSKDSEVALTPFSATETTGLTDSAPLLASAIRNEEIRLDYEGLIERFAAFDHLREDFLGVTQRFVAVVDELEQLKKDKAELQGEVELSDSLVVELRGKLIDLEPKYEILVSEVAALQATGERARETIAKLELAKQKEQEDHQATRDIVKSREGDLADARAKINALQDEISAGRRELDRLSAALAEREIALDQVSSALRSSEDQGRILKTMLDESTFQTARLSRTVSELEPMAERYKSQIASLQAAVEAEREAKEKAAIDRIEGLELLRAELRATAAKLEAATQRADTQEKMLLSARNSYREKLEELRTVERSVIDITMQLANMTRRAETAETDKAALASRVADLESVERGFEHRLNEINKILTEKETALLLARDQITFETSRLEEVQNIARSERTRYEAEMVELIKILDKERVNRTVLEGALLSNRRRHVMRGQEVDDEAAPLELEAVSTDDMSSGSVQEDNGETASISLTDDLAEAGAVILEFERTAVNHTPDHALAVAAIDAPLTDEARQAVPSAS